MKNRQFIVIILCICLFGGLGLFFSLQNQTGDVVITDNLTEKEKIDNYFKDKDLLYEHMLQDMGYNADVTIEDDNSGWDNTHDKEMKIYCKDCKCNEIERLVPLMVMLISEEVDSLIGRPGYINIELFDSYWCEDQIKYLYDGQGCGGKKGHAECY